MQGLNQIHVSKRASGIQNIKFIVLTFFLREENYQLNLCMDISMKGDIDRKDSF